MVVISVDLKLWLFKNLNPETRIQPTLGGYRAPSNAVVQLVQLVFTVFHLGVKAKHNFFKLS